MSIKRKKKAERVVPKEIRSWIATTPNRRHQVEAADAEEAAALFMERFGYYPDVNQLEPVIK